MIPEAILASLQAKFPSLADELSDVDGPLVPVEQHVAFATALKELGYTVYISVIATHMVPEPPKRKPKPGEPEPELPPACFEVATVLRNPAKGASQTAAWRVKLAIGQTIPTLFPLFAGADWQEREQYDLVGVVFSEHPDLRRLMLPEDWEGHPLQKQYAIDTPHAPWR